MGEKPGLRARADVGDALLAFARDILAEVRAALSNSENSDAVAVHDFRKGMKRWRALLRLLAPRVGGEADRLRVAARDLARELAPARDGQSALDALADIAKLDIGLSPRSIETIRGRLDAMRQAAERTTLTRPMRTRLSAALDGAEDALNRWPLDTVDFAAVANGLAGGYARARRALPAEWAQAGAEELHALRQRIVVHRYQMDLVEPLWPRLGKLWTGEAQRLRERLGACQDLSVLAGLTAPHQPLAHWRARLLPAVAARRAVHVAAAARLAGRLFAERPRALRRRMQALWESGGETQD
jgi:CHAD domain-containing protein